MNNIFTSAAFNKQFDENGYIQVPLLNKEDINRLLALVKLHELQFNDPFHTSHFSNDEEYKQRVNDLIIEVVFPKVLPLLNNYRPVFGNFMIKQPDDKRFMPLHADWTYVDEEKHRSVAIWAPLVDVDERNGCLGVIVGSHKVTNKIRGPRITTSSSKNDRLWVQQVGKLLPTKAGNAIIYDHALLHFSPPNCSSALRPAINLSMVPQDVEVVHYCVPEGETLIQVYRANNPRFYILYNNYQRPQINSLIKTVSADTVDLIDERMEQFVKNNQKVKGLLSRLFGV